MDFKSRIRILRKAKDLTLRELSSKAGVSVGYLSELERSKPRGNRVTHETIAKIAKALGVTPSYLLDVNTDPYTSCMYLKDIADVVHGMDEETRYKLLKIARILKDGNNWE